VSVERDRLEHEDPAVVEAWRAWGPFVSEREWGTVREDYSADGEAWRYVTHDEARSYAYRWGEDALAGVCDRRQGLCLGIALWNGRDPIMKERLFGLTGKEGNHGEDVKECYWYEDATPTHSWLRWRYHYPQAEFPYVDLVEENARRSFGQREYELLDTGVFDHGYWGVTVEYAKAGPDDLCMRIRVTNQGAAPATIHVLPMLWFRNVWSWDVDAARPEMHGRDRDRAIVVEHHRLVGGSRRPSPPAVATVRARRCCSARTRRTASASMKRPARPPSRRTPSTTTSSPGAPRRHATRTNAAPRPPGGSGRRRRRARRSSGGCA
jgi:hypothetical protein